MRIRTIKPEFFLHDKLFDMENQSGLPLRLAYIGMWCAADREGRFRWEPRKLKVQIMPWDNVDFAAIMDHLEAGGFIVSYNNRELGYIPSFLEHQCINVREAKSKIDEPTEETMQRTETHVHACEHTRGREGKGRERNMEGKGTEYILSDKSDEEAGEGQVIEILWKEFPKKSRERSSKKQVADEWNKTKRKPTIGEIINAIATFRKGDKWTKNNGDFQEGAHLWIKNRQWESVCSLQDAHNGTEMGLESIASKVMALRQGWGLPLNTAESDAIRECAKTMEALTDENWRIIREYLATRLPEGTPGWQPTGRLKFIQTVSDVWTHAEQWARKNNKTRNSRI
jgi:hypothetical protein